LPLEARLLTGIAIAAAMVYWATPVAIRVAARFDFYDRPVGYKTHGRPTPYLGGAAVISGFVVAVVLLSGDWQRTLPLVTGVALLWGLGTLDDKRTVSPLVRVAVELGLAGMLWSAGLGWDLGAGAAIDLAVTAFWVVAVVNAFNLFDNMDGAAPSMAAVVAGGLAIFGVADGNTWLAVTAAALCGACAGFLPHNLTSPARIFLGDGGSMPIGFAVAALAMAGVADAAVEWQSLAMGLLFVGVPALDTLLVMVSRTRRGVSILTGGRDHLTHRTHQRVRTARGVAISLGGAQAVISALAIMALEGGSTAVLAAVLVYLVGVGVTIALLDARQELATPDGELAVAGFGPPRVRRAAGQGALVVLVPLVVSLAVSPYFGGFYDSELWVPAALGLVVALTGGLIARPPRLNGPTWMLLGGLGALALWSLLSALWAESIEQAVVGGNRLILYVVLAGVLLVLVRDNRMASAVVAVLAATVLGVAAVTLVQMLGSAPADLFVAGRLDAPLGYINGQASFYLIGFWACLAVAEQRRYTVVAGLALGGATVLGCLLLLSQSRGVAVACIASCIVVVALVPGRLRRLWALVLVAAGVAAAGPALVDIYETGLVGPLEPATVNAGARAAFLAGLGVAAVWTLAGFAAARAPSLQRRLRPVAIGALVAAGIALLGAAALEQERIRETVDEQYHAFVRLGVEPQGSSAAVAPTSRLVSGAGTRYDYWRIAWHAWKDRPVLGLGAGGYDRSYFLERATTEDVRQPHSIELQMLSELGIVGALLLAVALAGLAWGAWRASRAAATSPARRLLAVAGVGAVAGWMVHTSVDWIHLLPGVTGLALVAAVLLARAGERPEPRDAPKVARRGRPVVVAVIAIGLAIAGVSLSRQGLAEHFRSSAQDALATRPADALRDADRSLRLDAEAVQSYYVKAAALARFNRPAAARATLEAAAAKEPRKFVTWALLGDLAVRTGNFREARGFYTRAHELNPLDPTLLALSENPRSALDAPTS
jgi:UDP-GlcNAc:undecaprenyl-phosphate GlcNAc-1-phosphate transferase